MTLENLARDSSSNVTFTLTEKGTRNALGKGVIAASSLIKHADFAAALKEQVPNGRASNGRSLEWAGLSWTRPRKEPSVMVMRGRPRWPSPDRHGHIWQAMTRRAASRIHCRHDSLPNRNS